jgi:hypothetical protein
MSAFVVDPTHIDMMLSVAIHGPADGTWRAGGSWTGPYVNGLLAEGGGPLRHADADAAGSALLAECIESVAYRYGVTSEVRCTPIEEILAADLPGPIPIPDPRNYEWTDFGRALRAVETFKAIDCYSYQSCEHMGWGTSGAFAFCARLRSAVIGAMDGYDAAPWEWTSETALGRFGVPDGHRFAG